MWMCNHMQVLLPVALQANTGEAGADVKESGFIQVLATWEVRDSQSRLQCLRHLGKFMKGTVGRGELKNFWRRAVS